MKRFYDTAAAVLLTAVILLLIAFSSKAKAGAVRGIELCEGVIIPSLLPVLIITNTLVKSRARLIFDFVFGSFFEKVLKLNKSTAAAVIFGLCGGFPAGAMLTLSLYKDRVISSDTAKRLMRFNFSGGAAFIITAVGSVRYKSAKVGLMLFIISVLSSGIIAFVSRFFSRFESGSDFPVLLSVSDALYTGCENAVRGILLMSAYIISFSALSAIFNIPDFLLPLFEITGGVFAKTPLPIPFLSFFLQFGGLCIHLQLLGFLKEMNVSYFDFFIFRTLSGAISFFLTKIYLFFFGESVTVFNVIEKESFDFSVSTASFSFLLIIGCAIFVFDLKNQKLKLT